MESAALTRPRAGRAWAARLRAVPAEGWAAAAPGGGVYAAWTVGFPRLGTLGVVLAHHGLVTWGDTHEESYTLTRELVDRAAAYVGLRPVEVVRREAASLVGLRGRLSQERKQVLAVDAAQEAIADRDDAGEIASMRSTPDHMLRIGAQTGGDGPVFLVPGLGCVAAGPNRRVAGMRLEIAAHTHASVAATRAAAADVKRPCIST